MHGHLHISTPALFVIAAFIVAIFYMIYRMVVGPKEPPKGIGKVLPQSCHAVTRRCQSSTAVRRKGFPEFQENQLLEVFGTLAGFLAKDVGVPALYCVPAPLAPSGDFA